MMTICNMFEFTVVKFAYQTWFLFCCGFCTSLWYFLCMHLGLHDCMTKDGFLMCGRLWDWQTAYAVCSWEIFTLTELGVLQCIGRQATNICSIWGTDWSVCVISHQRGNAEQWYYCVLWMLPLVIAPQYQCNLLQRVWTWCCQLWMGSYCLGSTHVHGHLCIPPAMLVIIRLLSHFAGLFCLRTESAQ